MKTGVYELHFEFKYTVDKMFLQYLWNYLLVGHIFNFVTIRKITLMGFTGQLKSAFFHN